VLADLDKARMQGIDVGAHIYAFAESGRVLRSLLENPSLAISFAQYLREEKAVTLERVIQKLTGLPAARVALRERGVLRKGGLAIYESPDNLHFPACQTQTSDFRFRFNLRCRRTWCHIARLDFRVGHLHAHTRRAFPDKGNEISHCRTANPETAGQHRMNALRQQFPCRA